MGGGVEPGGQPTGGSARLSCARPGHLAFSPAGAWATRSRAAGAEGVSGTDSPQDRASCRNFRRRAHDP